jgi:hypothetical protein
MAMDHIKVSYSLSLFLLIYFIASMTEMEEDDMDEDEM